MIINWGVANSAWSGGENWIDEEMVVKIREWVYSGGGFIGVEEPTACEYQGRFFQLADVLGVQKEIGNTLCWSKTLRPDLTEGHYIMADLRSELDLGVTESDVYLSAESADLLAGTPDDVLLSTNIFGNGRAVYMADYKHNGENTRLFLRAILWAGHMEAETTKWFSSSPNTDCAYYPEVKQFVVINNTDEKQETTVFNGDGKTTRLALAPMEMRWFELDEINKLCK